MSLKRIAVKVIPSGSPEMPSHLNERAQAEWRAITEELSDLGILAKVDRAALAAYCTTWARHLEAEVHLEAEGLVTTTANGYMQPNPYVAISNKALMLARAYLNSFGLTPESRSKLDIKAKTTKSEADRKLDEFFGGNL